jgi:hypothetical protein
MKRFALTFCVCAAFSYAQSFTAGVKGGGLFTDPAERADESHRYVAGIVAEIGLGSRFAIEGNALYSRFGRSLPSVRGHSIELPVLGKFYFADSNAAFRPYGSSGFALRNIWLDETRRGRLSPQVNVTDVAVGAVFAGGVTFNVWKLKVSPELRYTRWGGYNYPATNPNQLQALVGITF